MKNADPVRSRRGVKLNAAAASALHSRASDLLDEPVASGSSIESPDFEAPAPVDPTDLETPAPPDLEPPVPPDPPALQAPAPPLPPDPDLKTGTQRRRLATHLLLVALILAGALGVANLIGPARLHQHATRPVRPAAGAGGGRSPAGPRARPAATRTQSYGQDQAVSTGLEPAGIPGRWKLSFDDEFNGSTVDTSDWSVGWFGSGITTAPDASEQNCEDPAEVSEAGGSLAIRAVAKSESCGGVTKPYASGLISSNGKFQFTYGAFEARIWVPGNGSTIADWPQFWSDGQSWPADGEIDALEGLRGRACYHFHYSGGGRGGCSTVAGAAGGWHTYAADWEPGSITYYYDGRQVWHTSTGVTSAPMYLILSLGVSRVISPPDIAPATMQVDYVRVWQHPS